MRRIFVIFLFFCLLYQTTMACSQLGGRDIWQEIVNFQTVAHWPDSQGAIDRNKTSYISVAFQKHVVDIFQNAERRGNECLRIAGRQSIEYGFNHMNPDGNFQLIVPPGENAVFGDELSGVAFFLKTFTLSKMIHTGLQHSSEGETAALFLSQNAQALFDFDKQYTNRIALDAFAFLAAGHIYQNDGLKNIGRQFLQQVINTQTGGVFPELGGYDSSYQAVTILHLGYIWKFLPLERSSELTAAINNGAAWLLTRIAPSGEVLTDGNTRTDGQEEFFGTVKGVNYAEVVLALSQWADMTDNHTVRNAAERVYDYMLLQIGIPQAQIQNQLNINLNSCN